MKKNKNSYFESAFSVAIAAGLYPFLHFCNNNLDIVDSWYQLSALVCLCFLMPLALVYSFFFLKRFSFFNFFKKNYLAIINHVIFSFLLVYLILHFKNKLFALILISAFVLGFFAYKSLKKIMILQFLLAIMSFVTMIPKLYFIYNNTFEWTKVSDKLLNTKFNQRPNIYLIQPDGYVNFTELRKPPYNDMDDTFEKYLVRQNFKNYTPFRSNYYSTLNTNSSMFSMKHHYCENTYSGNSKTFGAQKIILGNNNVLKILKRNDYKTHLLTDNSYFLINRKLQAYDYCNVPMEKVKLFDTGEIRDIDILKDFENSLQESKNSTNFYFIEKTTPSHIRYSKQSSKGKEREREDYLKRMKFANKWLTSLITLINNNDPNPLIIIAADHGGFVGLNYLKESQARKLNELEASSVFSSLLSIKWPRENEPKGLEFRTPVNLFRNIFSYLSDDKSLVENKEPNTSYIPLYNNSYADFYECIDTNGNYGYKNIH